MYNIDIICVGKLKEDYLRGACAEYSKRLSAFCKLKITELTPARILTGYVVAGVILSAVGLYKPLADFAGAGYRGYVHRGQAALFRGAQPRY